MTKNSLQNTPHTKNEFINQEVSCRFTASWFPEITQKGLSPDLLATWTGYPVTHLQDEQQRISWRSYRQMLSHIGERWSDEELVKMGANFNQSPWARPFAMIARLLFSPQDIYKWVAHPKTGPGSMHFFCIDTHFYQLSPHELQLELILQPGYHPSREFFLLTKGSLSAMPCWLGLNAAPIDMTLLPNGARYTIQVPAQTGLLARLRQILPSPFTARTTARELKEAHELLHIRYRQLEQQTSKRKQTEKELEHSQQHLKLALKAARVGTWEWDIDQDTLIWSSQIPFIYGPTDVAYEATSSDYFNLVHPDDRAQFMLSVRRAFKEKMYKEKILYENEHRIICPDGITRWVLLQGEVFFDEEHRATRMAGTVIDLTERKETEKALLHIQKTESLGILAGGVAHDFNNLLVAILGQTSLAARKLPPESPAQLHIQKAIEAIEQASDLTQQMLAYSGHGQFEVKPINLSALIQKNVGLFKAAVPSQVGFTTELIPDLPPIAGDIGQIQQVIMNLVINSAEAIGSAPGVIKIATSLYQVATADSHLWYYTGSPLAPGPYVQLTIQDDGNGIDQDMLAQIFDPFFTTKFTGRGLGLAAALGIIRGHDGGLWVESQSGKGTIFQLFLPVLDPLAKKPVTTAEATPPEPPQAGFILVIDDEMSVREAVSEILALEDIQTITAVDGTHGLELYQKHASAIRLVLLDLSMPGIGGEATLRQLRQLNPQLPILLSSGYSHVQVKPLLDGDAYTGFVQKPYNIDTLLTLVQQSLAESDNPDAAPKQLG